MPLKLELSVPNVLAVTMASILFLTTNGRAYAQGIDPTSAVRGSLGAPLSDLSLDNSLGTVTFFLNAGFLLLCGAVAIYLLARTDRNRQPMPLGSRARSAFQYLRKRVSTSRSTQT
jgi:hypothetical protein